MSEGDAFKTLDVLIADDAKVVRHFIRDVLEGYPGPLKIGQAGDGESCLSMLIHGDFDIAFVDVNMPGMSGLEALAEARRGGSKTFVVIMSTESDDARVQSARDLKAYEYLRKPFDASAVGGLIATYKRLRQQAQVLVVDDSETVRGVIRRVLGASQFAMQCQAAGDGPSAIKAYESRDYELIFLDINMPGLSGLDTLAELRQRNPNVKVVLITADQSAETAQDIAAANVQGVLYKPFFAADVDKILHKIYGLASPQLAAESGKGAAAPAEDATAQKKPEGDKSEREIALL